MLRRSPGVRIGIVARWKPLHLAHGALLEALLARCRAGEGAELLIGVGSSNRYGPRNPFTLEETVGMLHAFLTPRAPTPAAPPSCPLSGRGGWRVVPVPDLDDPPRWRLMVRDLFGPLDLFVSANPQVRALMADVWPLAHPLELVPPGRRAPIDGTRVRRAMARGEAWERLVPPEVAEFMAARGLPERFRREFGLRVLSEEVGNVLLGR